MAPRRIGLITLLVSAFAALLITRSVVRPLSVVAGQMNELASGRLDIEIENTGRGDEIGTTTRALASVQANLLAIAGAADEIAQGNLTVTIEPRSAWDRLGIALKTMLVQLRSLVAETASTARGA